MSAADAAVPLPAAGATTARPPAHRRRRPLRDGLLGLWSVLALGYLFLPIFIVILFSFNNNQGRFNFTWNGFTLRHWAHPFSDPDLATAFKNSLEIAGIATAVAVFLGTLMAIALVRYGFRSRGAIDFFVFLPLSTPEVVMGASLLGLFLTLNFNTGFLSIVIAHIMFCVSYVVVTVRARLEGLDRHVEEAAMDLGANELTTLRKVTLPLIAPGIAAAALLSAALSVDDYVITSFVNGQTQTFPLFIFGAARQGVPPEVNVLASALLFAVLVLMGLNLAWQKRRASKERAIVLMHVAEDPATG